MGGRLLLVPAPLDFGCEPPAPLSRALPDATLSAAAGITHWICENAKTTRAYLKRIGELHPLAVPIQQMQITELPREVHKKGDHAGGFDAKPLLAAAREGHDIGLVSEAGLPAVADPGSSVVRAAHELGIEVVPLAGPSSLLLALAASGLNGQSFAFVGYLPQDAAERTRRLKELETLAIKTGQTQLFIETPYRNAALWQAMLQGLQGATRIAISSGITLDASVSRSHTVARWRELPAPVANDTPAVFAIGR
jgi:16S rRNA (cytidine1402-2'-O)-methyltransferase